MALFYKGTHWTVMVFWISRIQHASSDTKTLKELSENAYSKIIPCLRNKTGVDEAKMNKLSLPSDAEAHYKEILELTKPFRNHRPHNWAGYGGPWIENHFIHHFIDKPLSYFGGMFPLFIQWTDIHVNAFMGGNGSMPNYDAMPQTISKFLRDDVIYITVCQDDEGLTSKLANLKPNILTFSAGGYGHIIIPLIKGDMRYVSPHGFSHDIAFLGTVDHGFARSSMLKKIEACAKDLNMNYEGGSSSFWRKVIEVTKFNLAPRGFGRTSYRLTEIIQIGRIPVYLYDDNEWLPYGDSNISVKSFGFSFVNTTDICAATKSLQSLPEEAFTERLGRVAAVREHYTYAGVIRQMERFFQDPLGPTGGDLSCVQVPITDHRKRLLL